MSIDKPSEREEEYFARIEFERRRNEALKRQKLLEADEKKRAKELHYMRCPKCGMDIIEVNYQNIRIDRCSACNGIWLDEGELDQILKQEKFLSRALAIFKK